MMNVRIPLNQPFVPATSDLLPYLEGISARSRLTNFGPLAQELEARLQDHLGVSNLLLVSNGTSALQIALHALGVSGPVLTSPYTFVATASAGAWMGMPARFADVHADTFNLDASAVQRALDEEKPGAIMPVHLFGAACEVERFEAVAQASGVPLIYDASHCFGIRYREASLLNWGDAAVMSLHATKVYHAVEGGVIVFRDRDALERARRMINFGISLDDGAVHDAGINAKLSEYHAAVGLCVLNRIDEIIEGRVEAKHEYRRLLDGVAGFQAPSEHQNDNGGYMPVVFESDSQVRQVQRALEQAGIQTRRYFYPCLNQIPVYRNAQAPTPCASDIAPRVLCLPLFPGISLAEVEQVCSAVKSGLQQVTLAGR